MVKLVLALAMALAAAAPAAAAAGEAARGRAIVANRSVGLCLLCHSGPIPEERFQGTLAPSLEGAGSRWTPEELRARVVDPWRVRMVAARTPACKRPRMPNDPAAPH